MLGGEKMVVLPSANNTNEWPQQHHIDEKKSLMASTGMEKQNHDQQQQQQQALKCPRCDSSNTKFCYYNNYSLSQPRHFCKACKRYWTRGGTLRNVPVGGGCRKNKRVKRASSTSSGSNEASATNPSSISMQPSHHHVDLSTSNMNHPLFYGLPTNPSELNLPYQTRVNNNNPSSGFDLLQQTQHQQLNNVLGLGFSSPGLIMSSDTNTDNSYRNGFSPSNPLLSSYPMIGSSTSSSTSTLASLIASSLQQQQQKFNNNFQGLLGMDSLQLSSSAGNDIESGGVGENTMMKEVKREGSQSNRFDWNDVVHNNDSQNHHQIHQQINSSSDPASLWNTTTGTGVVGSAWIDPSVPSLI